MNKHSFMFSKGFRRYSLSLILGLVSVYLIIHACYAQIQLLLARRAPTSPQREAASQRYGSLITSEVSNFVIGKTCLVNCFNEIYWSPLVFYAS